MIKIIILFLVLYYIYILKYKHKKQKHIEKFKNLKKYDINTININKNINENINKSIYFNNNFELYPLNNINNKKIDDNIIYNDYLNKHYDEIINYNQDNDQININENGRNSIEYEKNINEISEYKITNISELYNNLTTPIIHKEINNLNNMDYNHNFDKHYDLNDINDGINFGNDKFDNYDHI